MAEIELGTMSCSGDEATTWVIARLEAADLRVYRSFDLRTARAVDSNCTCPYHGTKACDCQMVVLLVYHQEQSAPATVVLHGHQGRTWLTLAEVSDLDLEATITDALAPACSAQIP